MKSIKPNLLPEHPLTQVVFVHDFLQLVFQDACFSIYNTAFLRSNDSTFQQGQPGFSDALIGLIGQSLIGVEAPENSLLTLTFQQGAVFSVPFNGLGPEAWQFNALGSPPVVAENA